MECIWSVGIENTTDDSLGADSPVATDLNELRAKFASKECFYRISNGSIIEGNNYEFKLTVKNGDLSSEPVSQVIERSAEDLPSVRFITRAKAFDLSRKKFVLKVKAKRPECDDHSKLIFFWRCTSHPELVLPNSDKPKLTLKRIMGQSRWFSLLRVKNIKCCFLALHISKKKLWIVIFSVIPKTSKSCHSESSNHHPLESDFHLSG